MSVNTSDFAALLAVARRPTTGTTSDDGGDPIVGSDHRRRRRKRRRHAHESVVLNAATEFARFQAPDELDNVFSETCLTTLNLCDLIPEQNRYITRVRDGCAGTNSGPAVSMVVPASERMSRGTVVPGAACESMDFSSGTASTGASAASCGLAVDNEAVLLAANSTPGVESGGVDLDLHAKLTCFSALWYQMSGGERAEDVLHSGNCLRADRREVLSVAASFRFGADKRFRNTVANALQAHRQKMDALLASLHMAKCKLGNHCGCDLGWSRDLSITTVNDVVAQAVQSVLDFCPLDHPDAAAAQDPVCATALVEVARRVWQQIQDAWIAALAVSVTLCDAAKELYARVAFVATQLQRIPRLPATVYSTHVVQLYTLMFVRTFEMLRQIGVNTMNLVHGATLEPWLRVADGGGETDQTIDENGALRIDPLHDLEYHEDIDRYAESDEDNDVQRRVRRFLLGYSDFLAGDPKRLAAKASTAIDLQADSNCEELVALNETALNVFLAVRMLYYQPVTGRLQRFMSSVDREMSGMCAEGTAPTLRDRKDVRQRLAASSDLYEAAFLVRQIRDALDRRCTKATTGTMDERAKACAATSSSAGTALDANSLMSAIECDVGRLTDKQFQLNERQWDDCRQWIFTQVDEYRFTYPYAVMSKLNRVDQLEAVRRVVSLYNQLLRLKFYRTVFRKPSARPTATGDEPMDWEPGLSTDEADANLAAMYDTVESELQAQQQREQLVRGTLRRIDDLVAVNAAG